MAFNLNGLNLNQSIIDSRGHLINSSADIMNRGDLGMGECSLSK
jgi:photosystem II P680 reaction center D1 protein